MKNIEKYTNTKDALKAYNSLASKPIPFDKWLESEYEEPRVQTLLEAAQEVVKTWHAKLPEGSIVRVGQSIVRLSTAIDREKRKPVRNFDKYRTAKEAFAGFNKMCKSRYCNVCPFSAERNECISCMLNWLYAEEDKEVSK